VRLQELSEGMVRTKSRVFAHIALLWRQHG